MFFFFQAEDGIRDFHVTGVQTCALPISLRPASWRPTGWPKSASGGWQPDGGHSICHADWWTGRSEERRVGKSVDISGGGSTKKRKRSSGVIWDGERE